MTLITIAAIFDSLGIEGVQSIPSLPLLILTQDKVQREREQTDIFMTGASTLSIHVGFLGPQPHPGLWSKQPESTLESAKQHTSLGTEGLGRKATFPSWQFG